MGILVVAGLMVDWDGIAIRYHRSQMMTNYQKIESSQKRDALDSLLRRTQSDFIKPYEEHRTALVRLGYFERREFLLNNLSVPSPGYSALFRAVATNFPSLHFEGRGYNPGETAAIVVWARPQELEVIKEFILQQDVPQ